MNGKGVWELLFKISGVKWKNDKNIFVLFFQTSRF
jgi:hypothetical protein